MQYEVEGVEIRQLVPFHGTLTEFGEVPLHALGGYLFDEYRVVVRLTRDQPDIDRVSFVAAARVGDFFQSNLHPDTSTEIRPANSLLGISAGQ